VALTLGSGQFDFAGEFVRIDTTVAEFQAMASIGFNF
jgi:hypothetical protein